MSSVERLEFQRIQEGKDTKELLFTTWVWRFPVLVLFVSFIPIALSLVLLLQYSPIIQVDTGYTQFRVDDDIATIQDDAFSASIVYNPVSSSSVSEALEDTDWDRLQAQRFVPWTTLEDIWGGEGEEEEEEEVGRETNNFHWRDNTDTIFHSNPHDPSSKVFRPSATGKPTPLPSVVGATGKRSSWKSVILMYLVPDGKTVFDTTLLERVREFEEKVLFHFPDYGKYCSSADGLTCTAPDSFMSIIYPSQTPSGLVFDGRGSEPLSLNAAVSFAKSLKLHGFFERDFEDSDPAESRLLLTRFNFGLPIPGYSSASDRRSEQEKKVKAFMTGFEAILSADSVKGVRLVYEGGDMLLEQLNAALWSDAMYAVGSLVFVFVVVLIYSRSFFLSVFGMVQIVLCFIPAMYIHRLFNGSYISILSFIALWLILGIGADDIFVLLEAWRQAPQYTWEGDVLPPHRRLAAAYRRAGSSMFATSFTTAAAFLGNLNSRIPSISQFGLFMGVLVIFNYYMIMTWFVCCVVIEEKYINPTLVYLYHFGLKLTGKEQKTASGSPSDSRSSGRRVKVEKEEDVSGHGAAAVKMSDLKPSQNEVVNYNVGGGEGDYEEKYGDGEEEGVGEEGARLELKRVSSSRDAGKSDDNSVVQSTVSDESDDYRPADDEAHKPGNSTLRRLRGHADTVTVRAMKSFHKFIHRFRFVVILIFIGLTLFSIFEATGLEPDTDAFQVLPADSNFEMARTIKFDLIEHCDRCSLAGGGDSGKDPIDGGNGGLGDLDLLLNYPFNLPKTLDEAILAPGAPSDTEASGSGTSYVVTWTDPSITGIDELTECYVVFTSNNMATWTVVAVIPGVERASIIVPVDKNILVTTLCSNGEERYGIPEVIPQFKSPGVPNPSPPVSPSLEEGRTYNGLCPDNAPDCFYSGLGDFGSEGQHPFQLQFLEYGNVIVVSHFSFTAAVTVFADYFIFSVEENVSGNFDHSLFYFTLSNSTQGSLSILLNPYTPTPSTPFSEAHSIEVANVEYSTNRDCPRVEAVPIEELPLNQWRALHPGGETTCARGGEFNFFVRRGRSDKVVVDLQGGGACWDYASCNSDYFTTVDADLKKTVDCSVYNGPDSLLDLDDSNPVSDWTYVFVPYCTRDIHIGNHTANYTSPTTGDTLTVEHKGYINSLSVTEWLFDNFKTPDNVLVTGCSAGGYGATSIGALLLEQYERTSPSTNIQVVSDSALGILTRSWAREYFGVWVPEHSMPKWLPEFDTQEELSSKVRSENVMKDVWVNLAQRYPTQRFGHYSSTQDSIQVAFYQEMGGYALDWEILGKQYVSVMESGLDNFRFFITAGEGHCEYTFGEGWNTPSSTGTTLREWIGDIVNPRTTAMPPSEACSTCLSPSIGCDNLDNAVTSTCGVCGGSEDDCPQPDALPVPDINTLFSFPFESNSTFHSTSASINFGGSSRKSHLRTAVPKSTKRESVLGGLVERREVEVEVVHSESFPSLSRPSSLSLRSSSSFSSSPSPSSPFETLSQLLGASITVDWGDLDGRSDSTYKVSYKRRGASGNAVVADVGSATSFTTSSGICHSSIYDVNIITANAFGTKTTSTLVATRHEQYPGTPILTQTFVNDESMTIRVNTHCDLNADSIEVSLSMPADISSKVENPEGQVRSVSSPQSFAFTGLSPDTVYTVTVNVTTDQYSSVSSSSYSTYGVIPFKPKLDKVSLWLNSITFKVSAPSWRGFPVREEYNVYVYDLNPDVVYEMTFNDTVPGTIKVEGLKVNTMYVVEAGYSNGDPNSYPSLSRVFMQTLDGIIPAIVVSDVVDIPEDVVHVTFTPPHVDFNTTHYFVDTTSLSNSPGPTTRVRIDASDVIGGGNTLVLSKSISFVEEAGYSVRVIAGNEYGTGKTGDAVKTFITYDAPQVSACSFSRRSFTSLLVTPSVIDYGVSIDRIVYSVSVNDIAVNATINQGAATMEWWYPPNGTEWRNYSVTSDGSLTVSGLPLGAEVMVHMFVFATHPDTKEEVVTTTTTPFRSTLADPPIECGPAVYEVDADLGTPFANWQMCGVGRCDLNSTSSSYTCLCPPNYSGSLCEIYTEPLPDYVFEPDLPSYLATTVYLSFGVKGVDRSGMDRSDPSDTGRPIFDSSFNASDPLSQQFIYDTCVRLLQDNTTIWKYRVNVEDSDCVMIGFRNYILSLDNSEFLRVFPVDPSDFSEAMSTFLLGSRGGKYVKHVGYELPEDNTTSPFVRWIFAPIVVDHSEEDPSSKLYSVYEQWEDLTSSLNLIAPEPVGYIFQTSTPWVRIIAEREFIRGTLLVGAISMGIAFSTIIIFTLNLYVAVIATVVILLIVVSIIGLFVLTGLKLGAVQAVSLAMIVGMAVDYSLHLGHQYVLPLAGETRFERTQYSVARVGSAVFGAALTTVGATGILMLTQISFFNIFGQIMLLTSAVSIVYSLFLLVALLTTMGPQGHAGSIKYWISRLLKAIKS